MQNKQTLSKLDFHPRASIAPPSGISADLSRHNLTEMSASSSSAPTSPSRTDLAPSPVPRTPQCDTCDRAAQRIIELEEEFKRLRAVLLPDGDELTEEDDGLCDEAQELMRKRTKYALTLDTLFRGVLFEAKELAVSR